MDEDILIPLMFFVTVIVLGLGVPLVRSYIRRKELETQAPRGLPESTERLERIEQAIEAMSVEVERISEGQRFVTRLLADRQQHERLATPSVREHQA